MACLRHPSELRRPPLRKIALKQSSSVVNMEGRVIGLFESWLEIERATDRPMTAILGDLNAACGTKYTHSWPSGMKLRGYSLAHLPTSVRRYMMRKVLPEKLGLIGLKASDDRVEEFITLLT